MIKVPAHLATLTPTSGTSVITGYICFNDGSTRVVSSLSITGSGTLGDFLVGATILTENELDKVLFFYITEVAGADFYCGSQGISGVYSEDAQVGNLLIQVGVYNTDPYRLGAIFS